MLDGIGSLLGALKHTTPVVFLGLAIASGLTLMLGDDLASTFGLMDFRKEYRAYLGATFVVSLSLVVAQALWGGGKGVVTLTKHALDRRRAKRSLELKQKQLHSLTPDEKAYLLPFVRDKENTRYFLIEDGVAGGLVAKGILYRSSSVGSMIDGWAHNIQPWAREYLDDNSSLLEGASRKPKGPPRW